MEKREGFVFYKSWFDSIKTMSESDQLFMFKKIVAYGTGEDYDLPNHLMVFWYLIQPQIDSNNKKYKDGSKGGRPKKTTGLENENHSLLKNKPKEKEKEKDKVKDNDKDISIEERKQKFAESLKIYIDKYSKEMLRDFYLYWTEHSLNNKKLKYELESTFSIPNRLNTWNKNRIKFGYVDSVIDKPSFNPYG